LTIKHLQPFQDIKWHKDLTYFESSYTLLANSMFFIKIFLTQAQKEISGLEPIQKYEKPGKGVIRVDTQNLTSIQSEEPYASH